MNLISLFFKIPASNATQVVIKNVSFGLSGNFTCEVTADSSSFSTATAAAQMMVVGKLLIIISYQQQQYLLFASIN